MIIDRPRTKTEKDAESFFRKRNNIITSPLTVRLEICVKFVEEYNCSITSPGSHAIWSLKKFSLNFLFIRIIEENVFSNTPK